MEELRTILEEIRPDVDFDVEKELIDGKILDSFDIIAIVSELNQNYDLRINVNDLLPENFNSIEAIWGASTETKDRIVGGKLVLNFFRIWSAVCYIHITILYST